MQPALIPPCPVCQNTSYSNRFALMDAEDIDNRSFHIASCNHCGLQVTLPHLPDSELKSWYHSDYHGVDRKKRNHPFALIMRAFMAIRLQSIKQHLHPGATVVDYGAGNGRFVQALAEKGIRAYGVENDAFQPVDKYYRPDEGAILSSLKLLRQCGISPDVVTLWHVLEHLADPCLDLTSIHEALSENGIIMIAVPNIQSGQAKITGSNWYHLDPPRHRWHFSEYHLCHLLNSSGFEILHLNYFDLEFAPAGWWQSLLNCIHYSSGFPIHYFKRGRCRFNKCHGLAKLADAVSSALPGGFLLPLSFLFSLVESACARGGSLAVIGQKVLRNDN